MEHSRFATSVADPGTTPENRQEGRVRTALARVVGDERAMDGH